MSFRIWLMAMLAVAGLTVGCNKPEPEPPPVTPDMELDVDQGSIVSPDDLDMINPDEAGAEKEAAEKEAAEKEAAGKAAAAPEASETPPSAKDGG
jgi:hypothetical protein